MNTSDLSQTVGARLKDLRESAKLSQVEMAEIFHVSQTAITQFERGKALPRLPFLIAIADYFDISLDYLCCRTDQPQGKQYECKAKGENLEMREFLEMCFDPRSPISAKLKESLMELWEEKS